LLHLGPEIVLSDEFHEVDGIPDASLCQPGFMHSVTPLAVMSSRDLGKFCLCHASKAENTNHILFGGAIVKCRVLKSGERNGHAVSFTALGNETGTRLVSRLSSLFPSQRPLVFRGLTGGRDRVPRSGRGPRSVSRLLSRCQTCLETGVNAMRSSREVGARVSAGLPEIDETLNIECHPTNALLRKCRFADQLSGGIQHVRPGSLLSLSLTLCTHRTGRGHCAHSGHPRWNVR